MIIIKQSHFGCNLLAAAQFPIYLPGILQIVYFDFTKSMCGFDATETSKYKPQQKRIFEKFCYCDTSGPDFIEDKLIRLHRVVGAPTERLEPARIIITSMEISPGSGIEARRNFWVDSRNIVNLLTLDNGIRHERVKETL